MTDSLSWNSWDDLKVGQQVTTQTVTITETHLVNWSSLTGDWFELHTSEEYARSTSFGQRLVHGPLTLSLAIGLAYIGGFVNKHWVLAWLGADSLRLPRPVFVGDTIHVVLEVLSRQETSKPDRGIVVVQYDVRNQNDESVLIFDSKIMAHRKSPPNGK